MSNNRHIYEECNIIPIYGHYDIPEITLNFNPNRETKYVLIPDSYGSMGMVGDSPVVETDSEFLETSWFVNFGFNTPEIGIDLVLNTLPKRSIQTHYPQMVVQGSLEFLMVYERYLLYSGSRVNNSYKDLTLRQGLRQYKTIRESYYDPTLSDSERIAGDKLRKEIYLRNTTPAHLQIVA